MIEEEVVDEQEVKDDDLPFAEEKDGNDDAPANADASDAAQEKTAQLVSRLDDTTERTPEEVEADIKQVEALASTYPFIKETPEYKQLLKSVDKVREKEGDDAAADDDDPNESGDDSTKKPDVKGDKKKDEKGDEEVDDDEAGDSDPFGLGKKGEKKPVNIGTPPKELLTYIEKNYAIKDTDTFFHSVNGWRNDSQKYNDLSEEHDEILKGLDDMPQPIKDAITAYAKAEDYYTAFTSSGERLNYSLDFDKQEKDNVVQHYYSERVVKLKDKLDDGDIEQDDYDERVGDLHDSAKVLYKADKQIYDKKRAELVDDSKREVKAFRDSATSSVEALKSTFPDFSKTNLSKIKQRLVKGDVESLFYKNDGTYQDNAAEMLAFAMYGKSVVQRLLEDAKKDGKQDANKKIVERTNTKPRKSASSTTTADEKKAAESIRHLNAEFNPDPYA